MPNDFKVFGCDTDSILFSKRDGTFITEDERKSIITRINALYPNRIHFEDDGYYPKVIIFKAKNYVLFDGKKSKIKGSALKDSKKEKALKEFQTEVIQYIIDGKTEFVELYHKYVKEIMDVKDITRWASKKTITDKVMNGTRLNETKVKDAISGSDYRSGDKALMFYLEDDSLCLAEKFSGLYNKDKLLQKLFMTTKLFTKTPKGSTKSILPADMFLNYFLKKNKKVLELIP